MNKYHIIFLATLCICLASLPSFCQMVEREWKVTGYVGEGWFATPKSLIGKKQAFYKGWAEGIFYNCNYDGQSMIFHRYTLTEFLSNREFDDFLKAKKQLGLNKGTVFVHRITCNGDKTGNKQVLYPFITVEPGNQAFYLYEGAIYKLVATED